MRSRSGQKHPNHLQHGTNFSELEAISTQHTWLGAQRQALTVEDVSPNQRTLAEFECCRAWHGPIVPNFQPVRQAPPWKAVASGFERLAWAPHRHLQCSLHPGLAIFVMLKGLERSGDRVWHAQAHGSLKNKSMVATAFQQLKPVCGPCAPSCRGSLSWKKRSCKRLCNPGYYLSTVHDMGP